MPALKPRDLPLFSLAALMLAGVALSGDYYLISLGVLVALYSIAAIGYQLLFGRLGLLVLSVGTFFGTGAYSAALATVEFALPTSLALLLSALVSACVAALVALPVAKLKTHYIALATLGLAELGFLTVNNLKITGGANGLYGVPILSLLGLEIEDGLPLLVVAWAGVAASLLLFRYVIKGANAARLATLREEPLAAASLGIEAWKVRLRLFALCGGLCGLAGGLQAFSLGVVSPAVMSFEIMVTLIAIVVVGGRGSARGAVIAAALLIPLPELFRSFEGAYLFLYGAALLGAIIVFPTGLEGMIQRFFPRRAPMPVAEEPQAANLTPHALVIEGLSKRFGGNQVLDNISFEIAPASIVGLIGPNGSGKTTLINLLSGFETADAGLMELSGTNLRPLSAAKRAQLGLARTFQNPKPAPELFAVELSGPAFGDKTVQLCSPSEVKQLDLARASAQRAGLMLLDEPAAGLNAEERQEMADQLRTLAKAGTTLLIVEHSMDFLLPLADRIICLEQGRVIADESPAEISANPLVQAAYLGGRI